MGVVYTAYDETLDRKVAVKVLHDGGASAQHRLLREAQAMARVSHPNVVTVLEAGVAGGQVYVAMEFIRGVTLAAWLRATERGWQEVLRVFVQAGRGLAAAHAAGLVHRDFKPSNVMIDESGRARVLDFGLVRSAPTVLAGSSIPSSASSSKFDIHLTQDDQFVGTPAYMAPEQWRGLIPETATDQFSFCVALYEALYNAQPFSYADLMHNVLRGRVNEPPRRLSAPMWLAAVVMRGLKPHPKDRFPGMPALLMALDHRRIRRWRRGAAIIGLAVCAALGGFAVARPSLGDATCSGAPEAVSRVWGQANRDAVAATLGIAAPDYVSVLWPRVEATLDGYVASWQEIHRDACLGYHRGERSGMLLDRQMRCLDSRLRALDEAVSTLAAADTEIASRALDVTSQLPPLSVCRNLDALASESPPPDDPRVAARSEELRRRLTRAEVFAHSGRVSEAIALTTTIVSEAEQLAYAPVTAEALLLRGRIGLNLSEESADRVAWLTRAISAGFAARTDAVAAEGIALRIFAMSREADLIDRALIDESLALALADRSPTPEAMRGLVLNNIGTVHLARQDMGQARRYFAAALELREGALGREHREVGFTLVNLALASDPGPARRPLLARALQILEAALGPAHPETLEVRLIAAHLVEPAEGLELLKPGCVALDRFLSEDIVRRTRCLLHVGRLAIEIGDTDEADASFFGAASLVKQAPAANARLTEFEVAVLAGYVALIDHDHEAAVRELEDTLATLPDAWWYQADAAELRLVLGHNLLATGQLEAARANFEMAVADYVVLAASDPQFAATLARARRGLTETLLALGPGTFLDAREQIAAALVFYRGVGPSFARQLAFTERVAARVSAEAESSGPQ